MTTTKHPSKLDNSPETSSTVVGREANIIEILGKFQKKKERFRNITHASEAVADELMKIEKASIAPSTLRRNTLYRLHLENYIQSYTKGKVNTDQREILDLKLRLRDLQRLIVGYEKHISIQAERIVAIEYLVDKQQVDVLVAREITSPMKVNERFYAILDNLMNAAKGFKVELNSGTVLDEATELVMFTERDLPGFFDWYRKNYKVS
jgi:hypothetical protein